MAPYDYPNEHAVQQWDLASQMALWRERALHHAQRAEFFKRLAEAERNGQTIKTSGKAPKF
jgi:hypothetical protein